MTPFASNPPAPVLRVFEGVPAEFETCLTEPAFMRDETTFCIWRQYCDGEWLRGPVKYPADEGDPDGSARLLRYLDGRPQTYRDWATSYYEREVPLAAIEPIYAHRPLEGLVKVLNG